jgi:TonB family protein
MLPSMANDHSAGRTCSARNASIVTMSVLALLVIPLPAARAQAASIAGVVSDSAGAPITGAEVMVKGTAASVMTGDRGEFRITGLRAGNVIVRARRLGFRPDSIAGSASEGDESHIALRLSRVAAQLAPVVVKSNRVEYRGRLAGYYERLDKRGGGYFITRSEIDRQNPRTLSQLLQRAPGMSQFRGRHGLAGVRMRGRNCWPLVWLDGTQMPSGEFDLDGIPPSTLHGIELYLGSTTAPMRYTLGRDQSSCGTILLWSRGPDTDPVGSRRSGISLESLVASLQVYTADQVESQAKLDGSKSVDVEYPPALFAEHTPGRVIAEFVVDQAGRVETETFGVVSSSDRLFSEAVRRALPDVRYTPAIVNGRAVRQLVQQPFMFTPPSKSTSN